MPAIAQRQIAVANPMASSAAASAIESTNRKASQPTYSAANASATELNLALPAVARSRLRRKRASLSLCAVSLSAPPRPTCREPAE